MNHNVFFMKEKKNHKTKKKCLSLFITIDMFGGMGGIEMIFCPETQPFFLCSV